MSAKQRLAANALRDLRGKTLMGRLITAVLIGILLSTGSLSCSAQNEPTAEADLDRFELWREGKLRGSNIDIWDPEVVKAKGGFLEDFKVLRSWGANLVLMPLKNVYAPRPPYQFQPEELAWVDSLVDDAERAGLFVALTCRLGPGRARFGHGPRDRDLWSDPEAQEAFIRMWRHLAEHYRDRKVLVGYAIICEPHPESFFWEEERYLGDVVEKMKGTLADWNLFAKRITEAIREVDPDIPILVNAIAYANPRGFEFLEPTGDPRTVYEVHFYGPHQVTHQEPNDVIPYGSVLGRRRQWRWDRDATKEGLAVVRRFQQKHDVPIFVGEFGGLRWVPGVDEYFRDQVELYEEWGWSWAHYIFREWHGLEIEMTSDPKDLARYPDTPLLRVFKPYFARNTVFPPAPR